MYRLLSDTTITDVSALANAFQIMHERYGIPHIIITSVSLPHPDHQEGPGPTLSVVGSTMTSNRRARAFKIVFPAIDCYFSGTGDMFAALMLVRMREAVWEYDQETRRRKQEQGQNSDGDTNDILMTRNAWLSDDSVDALDLPLARAAEKVLASMYEVLTKTAENMQGAIEKAKREVATTASEEGLVDGVKEGTNGFVSKEEAEKKMMHLLKSKAAELRLVRHLDSLRFPKVQFRATRLEV